MDLFEELLSNENSIPSKKKKSNDEYYSSPILASKGTEENVLLLDYPISVACLQSLINIIEKHTKDYCIVQVLPFAISEKDLKKEIIKLYSENHIDFSKYIKPYSKIIAVGRSIYSITENDMFVKPDAFYDTITFRTHFYNPFLKAEIFPVNNMDSWLYKDNFENFFFKSQLAGAVDYKVPEYKTKEIKYGVIPIENSKEFFTKNKDADYIAIDVETTGLNFDKDTLGSIQVSFNDYEGYMFYVPENKLKRKVFLKNFGNWIHGKKTIYHNGMFDIMFLLENGVKRKDIYYYADTMLMGHIWNEMQVKSLKGLIWLFLPEYAGYDREKDEYMKKYPKANFMDMPPEMLEKYGCYDAVLTRMLYFKLVEEFQYIDEHYPNTFNLEWTITRFVFEIALPALDAYVLDMKANGVPINWELLQATSDEVKEIIENLKKEIFEKLDEPYNSINLSSDEQLGLLLEKKGWEIKERGSKINEETGKGVPLTGNRILREWKKKGYKVAELLISFREYEQLYKTFLGAGSKKEELEENNLFSIFDIEEEKKELSLDEELEDTDEKGYVSYKRLNRITIHPSYMHAMADSLRSRCKAPNLQQLITARHYKQAIMFRRNIIPYNKDYEFWSIDYSSLQMVAAAEMCAKLGIYGNMAKVIKEYNKDFHSKTACGILLNNKVTFEEFRKELKNGNKTYKDTRQKSKAVNFSMIFLATAGTLMRNSLLDPDTGWSIEEVENFIESEKLEIIDYQKGNNEMLNKYFTVATEIRNRFMTEYSELVEWSDTYKKFVYENGYIRSLFGSIRRLPYMLYIGQDSDKKKISNYESITVNSPTQTLEMGVVTKACIEINKYIKENNYRTCTIMLIHDAIEFLGYKPEKEKVLPKIIEIMNTEIPEIMCGLPQSVEESIEDYYGSKGKELFDFNTNEGDNDWWDKYKSIVTKYADNEFTPAYLKE